MTNLASLFQIKTRDELFRKDPFPVQTSQPSPTSSLSITTKISPTVLFVIVFLALVLFVSGLLHLLIRFLMRRRSSSSSSHSNHENQEISNSAALQRQLQDLFHLHDSGLDQEFIDALPLFLYREIVGSKEPFDCAVCLCEFSQEDKLRLLPICEHAFHINCIDTWLLSNSTCPLCRDALFVQGGAIENPVFDYDEEMGIEEGHFRVEEIGGEKRVVHVKLGKFRNLNNREDNAIDGNVVGYGTIKREEEESSSSNLDARRCFSMGSYEYVVADANLRVALTVGDGNGGKARELVENEEGKRLGVASKAESFSVSKIWLWSKNKGNYPLSSNDSYVDGRLPRMVGRRIEESA